MALTQGVPMALTVSRQPPTAEACVRSRASPCRSWWTEWCWDRFFGENVGFPQSYHSTNASYLTLITTYDCQKDERAKLGNVQTWIVPSDIVENFAEKYVYVSL